MIHDPWRRRAAAYGAARWEILLAALPIVVVAALLPFFGSDALRPAGIALDRENGPIDGPTFFAFVIAGAIGLVALRRAIAGARPRAVVIALIVFSTVMLAMGLEEAAWGQNFFHFATPRGWSSINEEAATTVHNLEGVQDLHSFLLFTIGVGGLGLVAWLRRRGPAVLAPPRVLLVWLGAITVLGGLDWLTDNVPLQHNFDLATGMYAEVNELFVSLTGLIYAIAVAARIEPVRLEPARRAAVAPGAPVRGKERS